MQSDRVDERGLPFESRLAILLCLLFATLVSIECLARVMHSHRTATLNVEAGVKDALLIRQSPDRRQLLFAGNSLIYDDLSQPELQQILGSDYEVHTAGVPGSTFYDWRYGLHALFARGSQPDVLVFSISPSQFLRQPAATSLPVSVLWRNQDIVAFDRAEHPSPGTAADMFLQRYSTFFALKDTIRIYFRKFIPGFESLVWAASVMTPSVDSAHATEPVYAERLSMLLAECGLHTRLVLMIPPTNQPADEALEPHLKAAAESLGIPVIEPVAEREWPITSFREDHYHLTPPVAAEFSRLVATDLRRKLVDSANRAAISDLRQP